jgi:cell pole-organizing protein PopZ
MGGAALAAASTQSHVGPVSGARQEAAETQRDRFENTLGSIETDDDDQAETDQEEETRASVAVMTNVASCVTNDADNRRRRDGRPFDPFVGEMTQPKNWDQAGHEGQEGAVHGAGRRDDDAGSIPATRARQCF